MEEEQEKLVSEPSAMAVDVPVIGSSISEIMPPGVTSVQPIVSNVTPFTPSLAPIPRPLAPLPPRPPVVQNGDTGGSESESEGEEAGGAGLEYEISEESKIIRERQERAMQELLMRRRAAALAVPTNDKAVRARLRRLGEPMTLFGEREMERRDRLRMLMAKLDSEGQLERLMQAHEDEEAVMAASAADGMDEEIEYPFYTEGSKALQDARVEIAKYSIVKAAMRLHRARRKRDDPDEDLDAEMDYALDQARSLAIDFSENGDDRPLSGCSFSPDGNMLATW